MTYLILLYIPTYIIAIKVVCISTRLLAEQNEVEQLGVSSLGVPWYPQILTDQLSLPQPRGGGRLCPPNTTGTPGFSDLPTALALTNVKLNRQRRKSRKSNFLCDMGAGGIV